MTLVISRRVVPYREVSLKKQACLGLVPPDENKPRHFLQSKCQQPDVVAVIATVEIVLLDNLTIGLLLLMAPHVP